MKDCVLKVDVDDYARHVSSVTFVPTTPAPTELTWQGLTPDATFTDTTPAGPATWVCNLSFAQDWETPDSLSEYLLEHAGETKPVVFEPKKGTGKSFAADVTIVPGPVGGDVRTVAVGTVSMASTEPVPTDLP